MKRSLMSVGVATSFRTNTRVKSDKRYMSMQTVLLYYLKTHILHVLHIFDRSVLYDRIIYMCIYIYVYTYVCTSYHIICVDVKMNSNEIPWVILPGGPLSS